jgi:hypothetical protein
LSFHTTAGEASRSICTIFISTALLISGAQRLLLPAGATAPVWPLAQARSMRRRQSGGLLPDSFGCVMSQSPHRPVANDLDRKRQKLVDPSGEQTLLFRSV